MLPHKSTDKAAPRGPGLWAIAAILLLAVPLAVYLTNPITVRDRSLTLASFHDWVELSLLAYCGIALRAGATVPILVAATAPAAQHSMAHVA